MIIKNACIENSAELKDILIRDGRFCRIGKDLNDRGEEIVDLQGKLVLPPMIESHIHLDAAMTAGEPAFNKSGTLFEGIAIWAERKKTLTKADVKKRALQAIRAEMLNGVQYIRTHVDVCDPTLTALEALLELREEIKDKITLQIIAFPQEGIISYPGAKALIEKAADAGADGIGAIPHYEYTREYAVESLGYAAKLAAERDLFLDVHCDETDDESSRGLETLAAKAIEYGNGVKVTASHTTAMHSYSEAYMGRLMRVLRLSGINFVSNPLVNLNLQGRFDGYPKRRGLTRVPELLENGLNVSFGHDDIRDPWYPLGNGDLKEVVYVGLHALHMTGYDDIMNGYRFITHNAAKTLGLREYGIKEGGSADFVVIDAPDYYQAVRDHSGILYSFRNGKPLCCKKPGEIVCETPLS